MRNSAFLIESELHCNAQGAVFPRGLVDRAVPLPTASPAARSRTSTTASSGANDDASGITSPLGNMSGLPPWPTTRVQSIFDTAPVVTVLQTLEQQNILVGRVLLQAIDERRDREQIKS